MNEVNEVFTVVDEPQVLSVAEPRQCHACQWAFRVGFSGPSQCRRMPPTVTTFMVPGKLQPQIVGHSSFPQVDASTWCGEFAPRPAIKAVE